MKLSTISWVLGALVAIVISTGCTTAPKSDEAKMGIEKDAATAVAKAEQADPPFAKLHSSAAGYAVFPKITKAAVGVGGAYGKGVLYENGNVVGYCDMTQASIGAQLGGQGYTEIVVFQTAEAVQNFKKGHVKFAAEVSAVALKHGASEKRQVPPKA